MTRESLIDEMVAEARAEDEREGSVFTVEGFSNFFPEYRADATRHGVEMNDEIWNEAFSEYLAQRARVGQTAETIMSGLLDTLRPLGRAV